MHQTLLSPTGMGGCEGELSVDHGESGMSIRHPNGDSEYLVSTHDPTHTPLDHLSFLLTLITTELEMKSN